MNWKHQVGLEIDARRAWLEETALEIGNNPELGFAEVKAARLLSGALKEAGFQVTQSIAGLETAFAGCWARVAPT